jgi:ribonuclease T2
VPMQLNEVIDNMNKDWGTLACTSTHNEDFWEHEWSKHGTCSGFTQRYYFAASLNLYHDYDITAALADAGIVPDDRFYPISQISTAFTDLLGFAPQIECNTDPEGNRQLFQVYICVAKDGKTLIQCPAAIRNPCQGSVQFPIFGSAPSTNDKPVEGSDQPLTDEL